MKLSIRVNASRRHVLLVWVTGTGKLLSKINGRGNAKEISLALSNMSMKTHKWIYPFISSPIHCHQR